MPQKRMSKGKKVIYSAANAHGYFTSIIHRMMYNADSYAIYIGDIGTVTRAGGKELFDECILYTQFGGKWGKCNELLPEKFEECVTDYFDKELAEKNIDLNEVEEIYVGSYWSDFPIYVNKKGKKHILFQEAVTKNDSGIGFPNEEYNKKYVYSQYCMQKKYGIFRGFDNPLIKKCLINKVYEEYCSKDKLIEFDISKKVYELSEDKKELLIHTFNIPDGKIDSDNAILLLTQWYIGKNKVFSGIPALKMYGILLDMLYPTEYENRNVFIKPHPADSNRDEYAKYFKNVTMINSQFPSEFLGLNDQLKFNKAVTISSSSINSMQEIANECCMHSGFDVFYNNMFRVFFSLRMIKELNYKSYHFGIFNENILPMLKANIAKLPVESAWIEIENRIVNNRSAIVLYDLLWRENQKRINLSKMARNPLDSIFFIITDNIHNYIQNEEDLCYLKHLHEYSLIINPLSDEGLYSDGEEKIYVFCRDRNVINKINSINIVEIMNASGVSLSKLNATDYERNCFNNELNSVFITKHFKFAKNFLGGVKYKLLIYTDSYESDNVISYLRPLIRMGKIELLGFVSDKLNSYKEWDEIPFFELKDIEKIQYDYIIAADFSQECNLKSELVGKGIKKDKIIKGRMLENPCFSFEKYEKVHKIPGGISIISEHCFGGITYNDLDLEFASPFINMFVYHTDFFRLVENLEYYMNLKLEFKGLDEEKKYPIGLLGDVSLYFNHYSTYEEAEDCWNRRKERINFNNILVQAPLYNKGHLDEFSKIKYRKIGFSNLCCADKHVIDLSDYQDDYIREKSHEHFWEYVLDTSYKKVHKKFPRIYDPYKLLLGDEDYLLRKMK